MNETPLIAVVLATYNPNFQFFAKQINSIKAQTYTNWVCLIVDDCSTNESFQQIKEYLANDQKFLVFQNEKNLGPYHTFEQGLLKLPSEAELIAFCDQDDFWIPEKLEILTKEILQSSHIKLVHSDLKLINEKDEVIHQSCWKFEKRSVHVYKPQFLILRNVVTGCSLMMRRELLEYVLPFPEQEYKGTFHHDLWVSLFACTIGEIKAVARPLIWYRQHGGNVVGANEGMFNWKSKLHKLISKPSNFLRISQYNFAWKSSIASLYFARLKEKDILGGFDLYNSKYDFGLFLLFLGLSAFFNGYNAFIEGPILAFGKFTSKIKNSFKNHV